MRRRQSPTQFAIRYAAIKANLQETEGEKVEMFNAKRADGRRVEVAPTRHERHRAESNQHHQQGAL
jgi:hypothetical protein